MVSLEETTRRRDGVTVAEAVLSNDASVPLRVECAVAVDPYWPPRRRGVPAAGWDDGTVTVTVPAGGRTGVGFATPVPPDEGMFEVLAETAVEPGTAPSPMPDVAGVVRTLGDGRPPRDAVPDPDGDSEGRERSTSEGCDDDATPADGADGAAEEAVRTERQGSEPGAGGGRRSTPAESAFEWVEAPVARPVEAWLDDVEGRVERVEALADDPSVAAATEVLAAVGGVRGVRRTAGAAPRLRRLAERASRLADRAEAVDAPTADLEALS